MRRPVFILLGACVALAAAQNIILNSGFEIWLDTIGIRLPFGWLTSELTHPGSAVRTTDARSGLAALQLNGGDTAAYATTVALCTPGHDYRFSGWCKTGAGVFLITWLKPDGSPVGDPVLIPILPSTSYRQYTQLTRCPDSAVLVNLTIATPPYLSLKADDVTLTDTVLTGIEEPRPAAEPLRLYPRPGAGRTELLLPPDVKGRIALYDITGKPLRALPASGRLTIDTAGLPDGIYILIYTSPGATFREKLILSR